MNLYRVVETEEYSDYEAVYIVMANSRDEANEKVTGHWNDCEVTEIASPYKIY